jgi:uracil-DNA glycosylase
MHTFRIDDTFLSWRTAALGALAQGLPPEAIEWRDSALGPSDQSLFDESPRMPANGDTDSTVRVSKELGTLLKEAAQFRDPTRWAFLYKVLWRWTQGDRSVASAADEDGARLHRMAKAVRRAHHDMIAYVRFRQRDAASGAPEFVAWYEPDHDVLASGAEHFAQRMGRATWLITTPHGAAMWDGARLQIERRLALAADHQTDPSDAAEALWLTYYTSTFNPARLNEQALAQHMPVRFWKGLPEGALIPQLVSHARSGARRVAQASGVGALAGRSIDIEAQQAQPEREAPSSLDACRRCELWRAATQAVAGEGPREARIMLIGEQPGDQEDLQGRPFVGPAGQLLESAMQRAGLPRAEVYLTNAVKHFKWEPRGKRRLHKTAAQKEVDACSFWLEREFADVSAGVVVMLGATALGALLGKQARLQAHLGRVFAYRGKWAIATYHPSFALRQQEPDARERAVDEIVKALDLARQYADRPPPAPDASQPALLVP